MSKVKFKNMLYDLEFKYIFSHEEILKDFINSFDTDDYSRRKNWL